MFNKYLFDKKMTLNNKVEKAKEKYLKNESERKKKQEHLVLNYKKRVDNFVLQMVEHPIITRDVKMEAKKFRDDEPSKYLGSPSFAFNTFKNEKVRIKETLDKNRDMFLGSPVSEKFQFRKRDTSKEIQPDMHFTSTGVDRIAAKLETIMNNSIEFSGTKPPKLSESFLLEISKSPVATKRFIAKNLLPELHHKTHFKAATSLYLSLPDSLLDQYEKELQRIKQQQEKEKKENSFYGSDNQGDPTPGGGNTTTNAQVLNKSKNSAEEIIEGKKGDPTPSNEKDKNKKKNNLEGLDPREVSKNILLKCNVIQKRKDNTSVLGKGDGHLISNSEKDLRSVYHELYTDNEFTIRNHF